MATHLRRQNNRKVTVLNAAQAWPAASHVSVPSAISPAHIRPTANNASGLSSSSGQNKPMTDHGPVPASYASSVQARPSPVHEHFSAGSFSSSRNWGSSNMLSHSTSAPNLVDTGFSDSSISDFPPVYAAQPRKFPASGQAMLNVDVHTANKSLVERIRADLEFDHDKYSAFKDISAEYRLGLLDAETYLAYVEQFGLSHLVLELARLCPDTRKQKELVDTYNATLVSNGSRENSWRNGSIHLKDGDGSKKGKVKSVDVGSSGSKDNLADAIISTVRKLQSSYQPSDEEEVLSKDGYRAAKGKSKMVVDEPQVEFSSPSQTLKLKGQSNSLSVGVVSNQILGDGGGKSKQRKKTSKFHRVRLGDGSVAALLDLKNSDPADPNPDLEEEVAVDGSKNSTEGLPVHGVWRNGGGQRLLAKKSRDPKT
ncbi:unnamed protein product [Ilex paraguariensis]